MTTGKTDILFQKAVKKATHTLQWKTFLVDFVCYWIFRFVMEGEGCYVRGAPTVTMTTG